MGQLTHFLKKKSRVLSFLYIYETKFHIDCYEKTVKKPVSGNFWVVMEIPDPVINSV